MCTDSGVGTGGPGGQWPPQLQSKGGPPGPPPTLNGPTLPELDRCSKQNELKKELNDNTLVTCFILNAILELLYNLNV